ncbi:MAG: hypothetical protein ACRDQ5_09795 [Sciscionella sp.]
MGDESLLGDTIEHNRRAIALCRDCGYDVADVGGVAAVTSYDPATGEPASPPAEVLDYLRGWAPGDGELARAAGLRLLTPEEVDAYMQQRLHDRHA